MEVLLMNDKLERMWTEVVVVQFEVLLSQMPAETDERHGKHRPQDRGLNPGPP
jgi:hypothetical protein